MVPGAGQRRQRWWNAPAATSDHPSADLGFTCQPYIDLSEKRIYITFKNSGNTSAGGFRVNFLVNNTVYDYWVFSSAAPGATQTIYADVSGLSPADTYNFVLDAYNTVAESHEGNNSYNGYIGTVPVVD
ncbi:CARDB domain-containing protein [Kribbella sp. NPDC023855]|uniref:CARDB domain-containing protein n=1 Tax=Kribbella sp. NPDC023855 TaxID=3154698 RepID=UPI003411499F